MVLNPTVPAKDPDLAHAIAADLERLCDWAAAAVRQPIPEQVSRRGALVISDDIAAMTVAANERQVADAQAMVLKGGGDREATVFGRRRLRGTREQAAAANGVAVCWAELDEGYRPLPCHAGAYVLPALLAEAEAEDASVEQVVAALAVGYEVTTRIAETFPFPRLTVHPHGGFNAVGAAAGLALLRHYDPKRLFDTITAAATMVAPGPFNHAIEGALVRNIWTSLGATAGFRAADFASLGIAGLRTALYDVYADCLGCNVKRGRLVERLGTGPWAIEAGYHKMFACCQYMHAAVEASLDLSERLRQSPDLSVRSITVETHARGLALDVREPETVLAAKFSMPHTMAAAVAMGTAGPTAFREETLRDPAITDLREKVNLVRHDAIGEWPNDRPARVHWDLADGTRLSAECWNARGGADQPFSEAELLEKFSSLTGDALPGASAVLRDFVAASGRSKGSWRDFVGRLVA